MSPDAKADMAAIGAWIGEAASNRVARRYVSKIHVFIRSLTFASERGRSMEQVRPGLRAVGFGHRVVLLIEVDNNSVNVLRVFYGGQDWERLCEVATAKPATRPASPARDASCRR